MNIDYEVIKGAFHVLHMNMLQVCVAFCIHGICHIGENECIDSAINAKRLASEGLFNALFPDREHIPDNIMLSLKNRFQDVCDTFEDKVKYHFCFIKNNENITDDMRYLHSVRFESDTMNILYELFSLAYEFWLNKEELK